ncbi:MAG: virulence RhuM family protein [Colwellia sp.]|nr:virulence RhuM family protein [Colwellia sp.]
MNDIKIFESAQGEIQVKLEQETIWLSQITMAKLFETSTDNISLHLKNIYSEAELEETSTTEDYSVVRKEGNRQVKRKLKHYNLDAIISVGYRVKSHTATKFCQWATQLLKQHLTQGYTLNKQRFEDNALELEAALKLIKKASLSDDLTKETGKGLVEIVSRYTQTFLWLQRYDEGFMLTPESALTIER